MTPEPLRIRLLPSAAGAQGPQFTTSYLIGDRVAIDAGCVGFQASLETQLEVEHVFVTHTHADHIASLPILLENAMFVGRTLNVWGSRAVLKTLREDVFHGRLWPDLEALSTPDSPFVAFHELEAEEPVEVAGVRLTPIKVHHTVHSFGFLVEQGDAAVLIPSDTGPTERIWELAQEVRDLRAVFLEASFPNEQVELAEISLHLTPRLFAQEVRKLRRDVRWIAVHMKPQFRAQIEAQLAAQQIASLEIGEVGEEYVF